MVCVCIVVLCVWVVVVVVVVVVCVCVCMGVGQGFCLVYCQQHNQLGVGLRFGIALCSWLCDCVLVHRFNNF